MPPSSSESSTFATVTNSGGTGEQVTNVDDAGEQVTNSSGTGEQITNVEDSGVSITNTDDAGEEVAKSGTRRKLYPDSVGIESSDDEVVNIVLNTASRPAGRPREERAVRKQSAEKNLKKPRLSGPTNQHVCDGCVFVAALKVADSWVHSQNKGRIFHVHVVDSVFLDFHDASDRQRMLNTSNCVLSNAVETRIVLVPVHIFVDIQHWCAAIIDFGSKIVWIYDPKR
eukprot:jgi/Phyca11/124865/e_gw1.55.216.1